MSNVLTLQEIAMKYQESVNRLSKKLQIISPMFAQVKLEISEKENEIYLQLGKTREKLTYLNDKNKFYIKLDPKKKLTFEGKILKYMIATINRGFVPYVKVDGFLYAFVAFSSVEINGLYLEITPLTEKRYFMNGELKPEVNIYQVELVPEYSILQATHESLLDEEKLTKKLNYSHIFKKKSNEEDPDNFMAVKFGPILTDYVLSFQNRH